ncbi:hypothetical protein BGX31_002543 [Mortierella sp. GBA43]|nr:hypothetical protein BGX31_002543 [Mortierella sp. GBA43]
MTVLNFLSERAQENLHGTNVMIEGVIRANANKFHIKSNPGGIINLGVAENQLMTKELSEILFGYGESPSGSKLLRNHLANNVFNRYFAPHEPVRAEHIVVAAGCSAIIDNFTFCVCDPGDGILITTPFYGGFNADIMDKSKARVIPVHLGNVSPFDVAHVELMQQAVDKATAEGTRIRAFVLSNPHNPLGRIYSRELIIEFLKFASRNRLHILFDEIYALSVYDKYLTGAARKEQPDKTPFTSVLSLPNIEDYCEKELIHVAYGMSKVLYPVTRRKTFYSEGLKAEKKVFTWISSTTEAMVTKLLEDPETIERFVKKNQKRLAKSYTVAVDTLRAHNIPFLPAQGGHFIWVDLRQYIPPPLLHLAEAGHREAEYRLFKTMVDEGVYVNLGEAFAMRKVGFFRLTFSVPVPVLKIGLERLIRACQVTSVSLGYSYPN